MEKRSIIERRERARARMKKWRIDHPIKAKRRERSYYHRNIKKRRLVDRIRYYKNKEQRIKTSKKWYLGHRRKMLKYLRSYHLRKNFGLLDRHYKEMFIRQKGKCHICKQKEIAKCGGKKMRLKIDHCHKNGNIRGLLCHKCNIALGLVNEDKKILRQMIKYIDKFKQ